MQKKTVVAKHVVLFALVFLTTSASQAASKQSLTLNDLTDRADVIMVAKILRTDYSRTGVDGPMIATAKVIKCIKGKFSPGNTFDFAETGWWGPEYKKEETRILFLNRQRKYPAPAFDVHTPWHTAYANSLNFFIDSNSLPVFSEGRLEDFLKDTRALQRSKAKLSATVQEQTKDSFIILVRLSTPDEESTWIHRKTFMVTFHGKKDGKGFVYVLDLPIPGDRKAGPLIEIKADQPLKLRFQIKREQVEGMGNVQLIFSNRVLIFPKRCWSGLQSVDVKMVVGK